jgi:hypothetical protein
MPITAHQFEMRIGPDGVSWMLKVLSFLKEHRNQAFDALEVAAAMELDVTKIVKLLEEMVSTGAVAASEVARPELGFVTYFAYERDLDPRYYVIPVDE